MKKLLIDNEVEKHLIQIFDGALKSSGFAMHGIVQAVLAKIVEEVEPKSE